MKKMIFSMLACAGIITLGACSGNGNCNNNTCNAKGLDEDKVYTGVLPAADADGVRYTLRLDYDDDNNYTDGDYDMVATYLVTDSVSSVGSKDVTSFQSEGDFKIEERTVDGKVGKYMKLTPKKGSGETPVYFVVDSDTTLTMVTENLEPSQNPGLNYTLRLVK